MDPARMGVAVILTHGVPPSRETLDRVLERADLLVCADGGADHARALGLTPEAIVGDLDSVTEETLAHFVSAHVVRDTSTEHTDTEKAIQYVLTQGAPEEIVLLGGSADRLDHVIGHLSLLHRFQNRVRIVLEDDRCRAWLGEGTVTLDYPAGTVISFFAVGAPAEGVTTENLRYPLLDRQLELGTQDSISNVIDARPARVRIRSGRLLFFVVTRP
jgi:thiamine pyrophosphokinase